MMHLNPLVLVGAVIGVITALLVAAYAAVKDKKTAMGFERNMEDGEIMRRLARYARPYLSKFLIVGLLMLFSIAYDIISPLIVGRIEELVAGRSVSGDDIAHCAFRNMSCCVLTGQGAGVAAAVSLQEGSTTQNVSISRVQHLSLW